MNSTGSLFGAIGWFIAIAVAIPFVLWLVRRSPMGARLASGPVGAMRVVAQLALSPQNRVATVEVGSGDERRWLVLGVAPGGVSLLYSLTPQEAPPAPTPATPADGFQQLLHRLKNGGDDRAR